MTRRPLSQPTSLCRGFSVFLLLILLIVGCVTTSGTQPPTESSLAAISSLAKALDLFNEAVKSDQPAVKAPAAARQKYQQVVDKVKKEVMDQSDASGKVSGYALLAFSQWRLGDYAEAMKAGERGRQLYETTKLATNRRDYGMLLMQGGLSAASQAYQAYLNLQVSPTKEQAQKLTGDLEHAMRAIDSSNTYLARQEPIAVYANLWQLALVDAAVRIWTGLPKEVSQPEVCRWLGRAEPVLAKIPATDNPWQNLTVTYKNKFEQKKKAECQGR